MPKVLGSLPKEVVRRIVRAHINEIRRCYVGSLATRPRLTGRLEVQFAVNAVGKVSGSRIASSTLRDPAVEDCVAQAVRRWPFPKPTGSVDIIHQIFVLRPE
ncbi:MAG: AgmX/PglI C-terminal domain-containing protein [Nannocystaceae bacterium]